MSSAQSTRAIQYTVRHTKRFRPVPTSVSQPCTLLVAAVCSGETSVQLEIPCASGALRSGQPRFDYERQFTALVRDNFPYVPDCCAKKVFDTFAPILELANNAHICPYHCFQCGPCTAVHTVEIQVQPFVDPLEFFEPVTRPATNASVADLFKARIDELEKNMDANDLIRECVICMEDMESRNSTLRMPCSHRFHDSCLVRWLNNSHVCPLCRYQMPTDR